MKVKIPTEIKIGGHLYKIRYQPYLSKDTGCRGVIEHRLQEIWIDPDNPLSQMSATFIHECLHLISTIWSISLEDDDVDRVAEGIYQLLSDSFNIEFDWAEIKDGQAI